MITIKFNIDYTTQWGEELCISGSLLQLGRFNHSQALILSTDNGHNWSGEIHLTSVGQQTIEYYYFVRKDGIQIRKEEAPNRLLMVNEIAEYSVTDYWRNKLSDSYLYTSAFTDAIFKHSTQPILAPQYNKSIILNVICPFVAKDQHLVVSGGSDALGNWDLRKATPLIPTGNGEWQVELNAIHFTTAVPYKFAIANNSDLSEVQWEEGENRYLSINDVTESESLVYVKMEILYRYPSFHWKGKGVAIPLFSIKSESSAGIGDFADVRKMVDWAAATNQSMIQILPINDTNSTGTWKDSYPYNSISIFALNPIYISLNEFKLSNKAKLKSFASKAKKLNALATVDYEQVFSLKQSFLKELFAEEREKVMRTSEYFNFYNENEDWLFPYICFCYLRDKFATAYFKMWGDFEVYNPSELKKLLQTDENAKKETDFYAFLQFLAHQQLSRTRQYAQEKGVALKGDIPIGINRDSVEAWTEPYLFNMDMQSGAPPDDFAVIGQNWGFPTYNWEEMERNNFQWWERRFQKMADYFDAYRIDHILGFFRIWEIPTEHIQGLLGHFSPALPYSQEELIRLNFPFDEYRMTKPYIHESMLADLFGEYATEVASLYLDLIAAERFQLKESCNTQRKIAEIFVGKQDTKSNVIRKGLFDLCVEVLFVPDPYESNHFHPRITAQQTYSFSHLEEHTQEHYNDLYNDFFYKRHNQFWYQQAMRKLPQLISATNMLVCGEDLGMVPDSVKWVMDELKILSLEIQRMPKESNVRFADLSQLPYLSVATPSTHDMSTIREWWSENRENTQFYYNNVLEQEGEAPQECTPEICDQIIDQHLSSSSQWAIIPWQDWMSIDGTLRRPNPKEERINVPSNSDQYWQYRMHLSIEELLRKTELNERIKRMGRE